MCSAVSDANRRRHGDRLSAAGESMAFWESESPVIRRTHRLVARSWPRIVSTRAGSKPAQSGRTGEEKSAPARNFIHVGRELETDSRAIARAGGARQKTSRSCAETTLPA